MKRLAYVTSFKDRHGKRRYRFRRKGYATHYFTEPFGTKAFEREYAACMAAEPPTKGAGRIVPGSISDMIARYYESVRFTDLRPSTQTVYRGVLERFRDKVGGDPIRGLTTTRIDALMIAMKDRPHAAIRLRKLLRELFRVARKQGLMTTNPVDDSDAPRAPKGGYHQWTEDELTMFEIRHPLGTKPRLAYALLLYGAQRGGDVRVMTHDTIAAGRIALDQRKTDNAVSVPVVEPLREALEAGPLGAVTLLETNAGKPFSERGFGASFKRWCVQAGLPHCSAHGLRKAAARRLIESGCTVQEGMSITGHRTEAEFRRYWEGAARSTLADTGMAKVMATHNKRLADAAAKPLNEGQEND